MRRALVLGSGGLRGAFCAGVVTELVTHLGPEYFDAIYASSVGVYAATFYLSDQPEIIEFMWRELVSDEQLVNYSNPLRGRSILDLEYLHERFMHYGLDVERIRNSSTKVVFALTDKRTLTGTYYEPTNEDFFIAARASCAVPYVHPPVRLNGIPYIDGGLSDQLPVRKALEDGYEEVIAVVNKAEGFYTGDIMNQMLAALEHIPDIHWTPLLQAYVHEAQALEGFIKDHGVIAIRPDKPIPLHSLLDTDYDRINETFDMGLEAAREFLKDYP